MSQKIIYQKLSNVQKKLMAEKIPSVELGDLLPLIFTKCLEENLMFYFNFIENAVVLNLRDITHENMELNIRLYYSNEQSKGLDCKSLKEQILINAFLLTKKSNTIPDVETKHEKKIQESTIVPPTAIRTVLNILEENGEPITRKNVEKNLQLNKMSIDNRRKCIAYLRGMEE